MVTEWILVGTLVILMLTVLQVAKLTKTLNGLLQYLSELQ